MLFNYSSYARKPYFTETNFVTALDGWFLYQEQGDETHPAYFSAVPAFTGSTSCNDICFDRTNGNVANLDGNRRFRMCRPFTWKETAPLRGHTVTLSFDLKFGTGFPQNEENHGFNIAVYGTTRTENQASPNKAGEFPYLRRF
jgi:hypothetical protein